MKMQISDRWFKSNKAAQKVEANAYACYYYQKSFVSINISQPSLSKRQPRIQIDMSPEDALQLARQLTEQAETALGKIAMNGKPISN